MELLVTIGSAVGLIAIFDILVLRFGADSRPTIDDDRPQPLVPHWN